MINEMIFLGVDAGGTKTDLLIADASGRIIAHETGSGANAARDGAAAAADKIAGLILKTGYAYGSVYVGAAGAGNAAVGAALKSRLHQLLPDCSRITVASDAFNALNGVVGLGDGIALIAGTGSSAFVRKNGEVFQAGGRGYLIDDAGSGYWLGRECLNAAYRATDGRGPQTALVAAVEKALGTDMHSAVSAIYSQGAAFIASFAPLVFECADNGDMVALHITENCADELALLLKACHAHAPELTVCTVSGGVFRSDRILRHIAGAAAEIGIQCVCPDRAPVYGALIAAADGYCDMRAIMDNIDRKDR